MQFSPFKRYQEFNKVWPKLLRSTLMENSKSCALVVLDLLVSKFLAEFKKFISSCNNLRTVGNQLSSQVTYALVNNSQKPRLNFFGVLVRSVQVQSTMSRSGNHCCLYPLSMSLRLRRFLWLLQGKEQRMNHNTNCHLVKTMSVSYMGLRE